MFTIALLLFFHCSCNFVLYTMNQKNCHFYFCNIFGFYLPVLTVFHHHSQTLHDDLHWLPVYQRIQFKLCKCQHHTVPSYLADMCILVSATSGRTHLRSAIHCDLVIPWTRLARYGPRGFAVSGPVTWNSLPPDLRNTSVCCEFLKPTQD